MIKKILLALAVLMVCCGKEGKVGSSDNFTANQRQMVKWYHLGIGERNKNNLLIEKYADSIAALSKKETTDFKTLAYLTRGLYYNSVNNDSLSFKNYNTALRLAIQTANDTLQSSAYYGLGNYYKHIGDYTKSTKNYLAALQIREKYKDSVSIASVYATMGQLDLQRDDQKQALKHLNIARTLLQNHKEEPAYLITLHTLANLNGMNNKFEQALELDEEGIRLADKIGSADLKATFLDNKANCYMFSNQLDSARYYFNACLKIDLMSRNNKQISDSYANLAHLAVFSNKLSEVIAYTQKSIAMAEKINYHPGIAKNYYLLIDYYKSRGDYEGALEYSDKYQKVYKSMINDRKETAQAEFREIYESEKKEKQLLISKSEIEKKNTQFQILALVALALLIITYLIYRQQRLKNKQQEQQFQLKSAIKEIESQNQLHEQRLSISRDLHDNIGAQLTFVISSVDNIKFGNQVQDAKIMNQLTKISDFTKSTIIELRDTIWAMNTNEFFFDDLRSRIFNFIEKAKIAKENVEFVFTIDPALSKIKLSSIVGINIYRTIQEAVNNAIKYSEAQKIHVFASKENDQIKITITDDGKGFDPATVVNGNGLHNMKKRIEDVGGRFEISSSSSGTQLTILIA